MAFKKMTDYNEERYGGMFILRNDGDYADVVFLYNDISDVLVADVHYIKSNDYNGYVHCCGAGCPACAKDIRVQNKLFIPLYNINAKEIQFWDRTVRFEQQLISDVFEKYSNPSNFVFRITRHGVARDINTTYEIVAIGRNTFKSYDEILAENNAKLPDYYENVCRDINAYDLNKMLSSNNAVNSAYNADSMPNYTVTPRVSSEPKEEVKSKVDEIDDYISSDAPEVTNEFLEDDDDELDDIPF